MKSMLKTLKRIKAQCERHENCGNCIFAETQKGVLNQEHSLTQSSCLVIRAFAECMSDFDLCIPPCDWNLEAMEKVLDGKSI